MFCVSNVAVILLFVFSYRTSRPIVQQDVLSNDDDDDDAEAVPMSNVNDNFGTASTRDGLLHTDSGPGVLRSQKTKGGTVAGLSKTMEEDEDDDF